MSFMSVPLIKIIEMYPATLEVFRRYEKLSGCCFLCSDFSSTLEDVCRHFDLEPDILEHELEAAIVDDEAKGQQDQ